jgi:uncharacterized membrane protein YhfC
MEVCKMKALSNNIEIWIIVTLILSIALPIAMVVIWKKRTGGSLKPIVIGAIIFVAFSQVLEGIPKLLFFSGLNGMSNYILSHTWAYVLMGCLLASVFEEVGRFVAFRFLLRKDRKKRTAISYGIGHGGMESILVLGILSVTYLMLFLQAQNGTLDAVLSSYSEVQRAATESTLNIVMGYDAMYCAMSIFERVMAITLHISLSVVVFRSVWERGKKWMLLLVIVLHGMFDIPAALAQRGVISMPACEVLLLVETLFIAIVAWKMYKKMPMEETIIQKMV